MCLKSFRLKDQICNLTNRLIKKKRFKFWSSHANINNYNINSKLLFYTKLIYLQYITMQQKFKMMIKVCVLSTEY